jgi:SsrA-binding protein
MSKDKKKKSGLISTDKTVAENRRARFDYHIEETFSAGVMLLGTEVKSLRHGQGSIMEAHAAVKSNEAWLWNAHIPEYQQAGPHLQHAPRRKRKLLLRMREIKKLMGATMRDGYTIIPLRLYFDERGKVKLELALAKGKKLHDKRETEKNRDWGREKARLMREKG